MKGCHTPRATHHLLMNQHLQNYEPKYSLRERIQMHPLVKKKIIGVSNCEKTVKGNAVNFINLFNQLVFHVGNEIN